MSTAAQISANQANSHLSTGPLTEAGKAASSRNNLRLGFRSQSVLLPGDDPAEYDALLAELTEHFGDAPEPTGRHSGGRCERSSEVDRFLREMANAEWRLRRLRHALQSALTRRIAALSSDYPDAEPVDLQSLAVESLGPATGTSYGTWLRYETKFERQYDRAYKDWVHYQTNRRRIADKEADIWMRQAIFHPLPTKLASSVQNAAASVPSAQDATRASVVRGQEKRSTVQIPRNSPCPCGSREKYKRCCGRTAPPLLTRAA
jgi:hypothetical protein